MEWGAGSMAKAREGWGEAREDGEGGGRRRVRTGSPAMKLFSSTRVSRDFQLVGNSASSFHRDETFSFSLLTVSCKKMM